VFPVEILTIETASLGDRTYVVSDGRVAAVVDPQRDIDRVLELVAERGLRITDVFETHIHNDYVTGGLELARRCDATYHVNADDDLDYDRHPVADGDVVAVGDLQFRVLHTPGHTPTHLSYVVAADGETAVFTGGSMLYGSVGRTDLVSPDLTEQLTRAQFHSARRLAELDDATAVYPTHGFGSFCSSGDTTTEASASTIGDERVSNQALTITDEDDFVRELLAGLDAYPAYYAHMAPANRRGPDPVDLTPPVPVDTTELLRRIHAGEWVVDLRNRLAFASDHVRGTINIELDDQASTYLGWLIPWGTPVTLVGDTADEVATMQRQLVRIGVDRPAGQSLGGAAVHADAPHGSYEVTDFAGLRKAIDAGEEPWVLDARRHLEWEAGHLPGAHELPLHELLRRIDEVPSDRPVWIHCAGGYRASIGASLLARSGRDVVLIDDEFDRATDHLELA
jgi:hydroxyacylglutathione hydrolase